MANTFLITFLSTDKLAYLDMYYMTTICARNECIDISVLMVFLKEASDKNKK